MPPAPQDSKRAKGVRQMKCVAFSDVARIAGDERAKLVFRLTLLFLVSHVKGSLYDEG